MSDMFLLIGGKIKNAWKSWSTIGNMVELFQGY